MKFLMRLSLLSIAALISLSVSAQNHFSKSWIWNTDRTDYYYAATVNSAGNVFGQYCYFSDSSCVYILAMGTKCKPGSTVPVLLNSDIGSVNLKVICTGKYNNQNALLLYPFDDIDHIVRNATKMGIVVGLQDLEFKVGRFSLSGSTNAINLMRSAAEAKMNKKPKNAKPKDSEIL